MHCNTYYNATWYFTCFVLFNDFLANIEPIKLVEKIQLSFEFLSKNIPGISGLFFSQKEVENIDRYLLVGY